jgi:hypothetical protein
MRRCHWFDKTIQKIENEGRGRAFDYPFGPVPPYVCSVWDADRIRAFQEYWEDAILRGCVLEVKA